MKASPNMTVTLQNNAKAIDEVVVVGYGTQKKANLTGSVAQVKMSDVLGDRPVVNAAARCKEPCQDLPLAVVRGLALPSL